jgi:hypothetical protein
MDAETIRQEASDAILDLELDSKVTQVVQSGKNWCVQFEGDYGQYCDSFQNQFERDNSPRVIREKIKKHLLGQITQLRNKGGRRTTKKSFDDEARPNMPELVQEAVTQTARAIGDAIDRTLGFTGTVTQAASDAAQTVTAGTAELIRPDPARQEPGPRARRAAVKESARAHNAPAKSTKSGAKRKAAAKTSDGRKKTAGKKKSSKKVSRKR